MKRVAFVALVCAILVFALVAPASANQGGISGPIPSQVAQIIGWPTTTLQLYGGNFQPGPVSFPISSADGTIVGWAYFRITWCQGFIGYRINVPGLDTNAQLAVKVGNETIAWANPLALADNPTKGGLHAEGFITWVDVASAYQTSPNPSGVTYPSIQPVYDALANGTARIVVTDAHGVSVSGSEH